MRDPKSLNLVREFHKITNNSIETYPTIPSEDRVALRISLITEELKELVDATVEKDLVEVADALCDLQYVLSGSVLEFGLGSIFRELFNEVHRSNMSKACKTIEEAEETQMWYANQKGIPNTDIVSVDEVFFVIDLDNNKKTLKCVNYSPADLKTIILRNSESN